MRLRERIYNSGILGTGKFFISSNKEDKSGTRAVIAISNYNNQSFSKTHLILYQTGKLTSCVFQVFVGASKFSSPVFYNLLDLEP